MLFRTWLAETADFGFDRKSRGQDEVPSPTETRPVEQFDVDLMTSYLNRVKIGAMEPRADFMNEVTWGRGFGSLRLEVGPSFGFQIQRLSHDLEGNKRWITTKRFQLNRKGYGGYEERVASEIVEELEAEADRGMPGPNQEYNEMPQLVSHLSARLKRVAEPMFIYRGTKKVGPDDYQIVFELGGQGVQARGQQRVEQTVIETSYDRPKGTIRVTMYNVQSKVGGPRAWHVQPSDMDLYFFPSQGKDQIAEAVATKFKYY